MTPEAHAIQLLFYILNKEGQKVPFALNPAQLFLDKVQAESNTILIAKARQFGFSSFILGKKAVKCLDPAQATRAVVMSHEADATQRLLDKVKYYFKHMNGPKPVLGKNSRNEMTFEKTDSTFYIGTAGARAFGRGDTITDLHLSEYAWWEATDVHQGGVFEAVPRSGRIVIESTGNGRNNDFYKKWQRSDYRRVFYPWYAGHEYEIHLDRRWIPDLSGLNGHLLELRDKFNLSDAKMEWYEWKLKSKEENLKIMQQEYPSTPEECFQASGGALFPNLEKLESTKWKEVKYSGYIIKSLQGHPKQGMDYVLGADPSGGTGNDDAAIVGVCVQTGEQVLELSNNLIPPYEFTHLLISLANNYNQAFIIPEANNHGVTVVEILKLKYQREKIYKRKLATKSTSPQYGWMNTNTTKHALVGVMQEELGQLSIYGSDTYSELTAFEETPSGKLEGQSDNLVIATGLALLGYKKFQHLRREEVDLPVAKVKSRPNYMTFTLESVLDSIKSRAYKNFFGDQAGRGYPN
jgi:hypothetical protein